MRIKFLGASGTVTGSSYVLTSGSGQSILIDLGMFQGTPDIEGLNYQPYEYDCSNLYGAILTHAHLDHCGRLPILFPKGFRGKIWMTPATADLTEVSLLDSAKIAKQDKNPHALYDKDLVNHTVRQFMTIDYRIPIQLGSFKVTFRDAGHILGSASIEIEDLQANSPIKKIVFSGDLGNSPADLVPATEMLESADAVVMESTYGDELHPDLNPIDALQTEINTVEKTGGALLIPTFALEKTQELLHMIMHLKAERKVSAITPVYLDSPMAEKATNLYLDYVKLLNEHAQADARNGFLFQFQGLVVPAKRHESKMIYKTKGPKVIIAGSGMMTGGRIMGHAAHYLPMPSTRLFIVGYQGEGTLGREIEEGSTNVFIDKAQINVAATVTKTRAMSSHADQGQLLQWLSSMKGVKKVFITHGENEPRKILAKKITEKLQITDIHLPVLHEEVSF